MGGLLRKKDFEFAMESVFIRVSVGIGVVDGSCWSASYAVGFGFKRGCDVGGWNGVVILDRCLEGVVFAHSNHVGEDLLDVKQEVQRKDREVKVHEDMSFSIVVLTDSQVLFDASPHKWSVFADNVENEPQVGG